MKNLSSLYSWMIAHQLAIVATVTIIVASLRAVPAEKWNALESQYPRLANLLRVVRAVFPDVIKAAKAIYMVWSGKPWPINVSTTVENVPLQPTPPSNSNDTTK